MFYQAKISRENQYWLAEFPDCPGCQTFAESESELFAMATEALHGWIEVSLEYGDVIFAPGIYTGSDFIRVRVPPDLAVRIQLRLACKQAGCTLLDLAERAGIPARDVAELENSGSNLTIGTLTKIATALGMALDVRLEAIA
ncbi:MAG: type II toxin-antitoxin system HicB family antitoxin [Polyangiaceae bacterium]|nr:type II toxin-antitoxin system HicB family antitoxin [Polyangiaceae bacterium]